MRYVIGFMAILSTGLIFAQEKKNLYFWETGAPDYIPFFPLGMPSITDNFAPIALGLKTSAGKFVSVWRFQGDAEVIIPGIAEDNSTLLYPSDLGIKVKQRGVDLVIEFPRPYMTVLVKLK